MKNKDQQIPENLISFIRLARQKGLTYKAIRTKLLMKGWKERIVFFAYEETEKELQKAKIARLKDFIEKERKAGMADAVIKERLVHAGWKEAVVKKAMK